MQRTAPLLALILAICGLPLRAQAPSAPADTSPQIHADMNQLMRGALYTAANVVFSAQADDPAEGLKFIPGHDPAMSTDPLTSTFGGWVAIENAALALAESVNLMAIPGRKCSTGIPAPIKDPDWVKFAQQVRDNSMEAYAGAKAKDQAKMIEVASKLSDACSGCHRRWRDRRPPNVRCK
jgi:hypothetical protein